ncbi:MAG: hypothetical protein RDU01_03665 [Thermodesulfovibrionales bacterium]|nr:hypothetical protein [Thermodesulfovibrionales bacterium]
MKSKMGIVLLVVCLLGLLPVLSNAATSSLDNAPGGAGFAYWQAGGGWQTLINIQEISGTCAAIHAGFYDSAGTKIMNFNLSLKPRDNIGIVVNGDGVNLSLYDYGDTAFGGTPDLNEVSTGPAVTVPAPAGSDGIQRGYLSIIRNNTGCSGPGGAPSGSIANQYAIAPDVLIVRYAMLNPNSAFALNAAMLQGFGNQGPAIAEGADFVNTTTTPNVDRNCDLNNDGDTVDVFAIVDDASGADIDFVELLLSDNLFTPFPPYIVCDPGDILYRALGSYLGNYWARYNENASVGSETILVLVAPQSSHPSSAHFKTTLSGSSYDDNGNSANWDYGAVGTVNAIPFGSGGISFLNGVEAGETRFGIGVPVFGFTFTETASFADLYPLVKDSYAIMSLNEDFDDDAVDIITVP